MKNLTLDFVQRVGIVNYLAAVDAPLGKLTCLGNVLRLVRLTDSEQQHIQFGPANAQGLQAISAPPAPFGALRTQLEDADAKAFLEDIESRAKHRMTDLAWIEAILPQLAASASASKKGK